MRLDIATELLEKKAFGDELKKRSEAAERMSPTTGRSYLMTLVCEGFEVPRSAVYWRLDNPPLLFPRKRGPKTERADEELLVAIRSVL